MFKTLVAQFFFAREMTSFLCFDERRDQAVSVGPLPRFLASDRKNHRRPVPRVQRVAQLLIIVAGIVFQSHASVAANTPPLMAIPGQFQVDELGAATYTIPIMLPPGTNGMRPDISLDYSSDYADGPEGLGWVVGGLPSITRCAQTIAQDGVHGAVTYGQNATVGDRFCLKGQRLVAINGGTYGANGTEYRLEVDNFTRVVSYGTSGSGPTYFLVWTKAGQKMQYGNLAGNPNGTASSAIIVPVSGSQTGPAGTVRTWALDTVWDTKGNYYRVIYDNGTPDTANGQLYPTRINYTANDSAGLNSYNSVRFVYGTRTDINPTYLAGSLVQYTVLLTDIQTYAGNSLVHDYQLGYHTADQAAVSAGLTSASANAFHDELRTIKQCDPSGHCLPTRTIGWQGGVGLPQANAPNTNYPSQGGYSGNGLYPGDFNGDGIMDVVGGCAWGNGQSIWLGTGGGNFSPANISATFTVGPPGFQQTTTCLDQYLSTPGAVADFDGDGLSDVVLNQIYSCFQTCGTIDWIRNTRQNSLNEATVIQPQNYPNPIFGTYADFNGDGLLDYFLFTAFTGGGAPNPVTGSAQIFYGTLTNGAWSFSNGPTFSYGSSNNIYIAPLFAADFDGDGCDDVWTQGSGAAVVYSCAPAVANTSIPNFWPNGEVGDGAQYILGDFNGDGKSDFLYVGATIQTQMGQNGEVATYYCGTTTLYLATGTGFTQTNLTAADWCKYVIVTGDFNGDGKADLAFIPPGDSGRYGPGTPIYIWLSTGTGFVQVQSSQKIVNADTCQNQTVNLNGPSICMSAAAADWNNDGATDLWLEPGSWNGVQPSVGPIFTFQYLPELVTSIADGIGGSTTISYGQLNDPTVYTKGTGATYPTQDVASTQYIVKQVQASTGLSGSAPYTTNYTYAGAKKDLNGRGFLGFTSITMSDPQNATQTTTNYLTAFPFTGLEVSQTLVCTSPNCTTNVTLKSTTFCYSASTTPGDCSTPSAFVLGSGRYFVPLRFTKTINTDQDGTLMPTVLTTNTYDCDTNQNPCYGDITKTVSQSTDPGNNNDVMWTKTTTSTYTDDANIGGDGNWLLARILTSSIESAFVNPAPIGTLDTTRNTAFCYDLPYAHGPNNSCPAAGSSGFVLSDTFEAPSTGSSLMIKNAYTYDAFGNKTQIATTGCSNPNDCAHNMTTRTTSMSYDTNNHQFAWKVTNNIGEFETWGTASSPTYDLRFGTPTKHVGPNSLPTQWEYDTFGRVLQELRTDNTSSNFSYQYCSGTNGGSDTSCPTGGPNGSYAAYSVDVTELGTNGTTQTAPTKRVYYDPLNRIIAKDFQGFPNGGTSCWVRSDSIYDTKGRVYETDRPYHIASPTGCTADAQEWITNSYLIGGSREDVYGRVRKENRPDCGYTKYAYSGLSTTTTEYLCIAQKSEITTTTKNAQGLVASVTDALSQGDPNNNHTTTYTYDGFGDLWSTTDPLGNSVVNHYDIRGRKIYTADPDMGTWTYSYDSWSELYQQTDAKGQQVTMLYDDLGRLKERDEPDMVGKWTYGSNGNNNNQTQFPNSVDKLVQETCTGSACTGGSYTRTYKYDTYTREQELDDTYGSTTYTSTTDYDGVTGKITKVKAFSGFTTLNVYDSSNVGYLTQVADYSTGFIYWQVTGRDAEMHATSEIMNGTVAGKSVNETHSYDNTSGRVLNICATTASIQSGCDGGLANFAYQWDTNGNLNSRQDTFESLTEDFCFDVLNRVTSSAINPTGSCPNLGTGKKTFSYDAIGNLTQKTDFASAYVYPTPGSALPHAVTSITSCSGCMTDVLRNENFVYDLNGNLQCVTSTTNNVCDGNAGRAITYTSFNMTEQVAPGSGTSTLQIFYDADHQRAQMCLPNCTSPTTTTQYMNDAANGVMTERITSGSSTTWRTYIQADGRLVAQRQGSGTTVIMYYFVDDNLGSPAVVTNSNGAVLSNGRLAYDTWGKMRNANGNDDTTCSLPAQSPTTRGFTGQEQIAAICDDNFNARVYSPLVARWLTPDSVIPDTYAPQSLNRYTYVDNMPLSMTDPTGHDGDSQGERHEDGSTPTPGTDTQSGQGISGQSGGAPNSSTTHGSTDHSGRPPSGAPQSGTWYAGWPNATVYANPDGTFTLVPVGSDGTINKATNKLLAAIKALKGTVTLASADTATVSYGGGVSAGFSGGGAPGGLSGSSNIGNRYIYANDNLFGRDAAHVAPDKKGRYMFFAHGIDGEPGVLYKNLLTDRGATATDVAQQIAADPASFNYTPGEDILLVVCFGGQGGDNSTAQVFANVLHVTVTAEPLLVGIQPGTFEIMGGPPGDSAAHNMGIAKQNIINKPETWVPFTPQSGGR